MSVPCGSLRAAPSPLVTAHLLADGLCNTYDCVQYNMCTVQYTRIAQMGKKEEHGISCHIVLSAHHLHTRPVLSHFLRLVLSP